MKISLTASVSNFGKVPTSHWTTWEIDDHISGNLTEGEKTQLRKHENCWTCYKENIQGKFAQMWKSLKVLPHKVWKFDQIAGAHKFVHILRRKIFLGRGECKRSWIENCSFHTRLHHSTIIWLEMNSQTLQKEWPIECTLYSSQWNIVLQVYISCRRRKTKVFRTTRKHIDYELHILPVSTFILLLC